MGTTYSCSCNTNFTDAGDLQGVVIKATHFNEIDALADDVASYIATNMGGSGYPGGADVSTGNKIYASEIEAIRSAVEWCDTETYSYVYCTCDFYCSCNGDCGCDCNTNCGCNIDCTGN